jgi:hypothetical protein
MRESETDPPGIRTRGHQFSCEERIINDGYAKNLDYKRDRVERFVNDGIKASPRKLYKRKTDHSNSRYQSNWDWFGDQSRRQR